MCVVCVCNSVVYCCDLSVVVVVFFFLLVVFLSILRYCGVSVDWLNVLECVLVVYLWVSCGMMCSLCVNL